ncbi:MAG: hypothetical protein ACE5FU_07925 [Nitrospinota bacterium]
MKIYPIFPGSVRRIPRQFSWVDHRLVRDRYIDRLSHEASALYLFLVTVADVQGLSYYSDPTLFKRLSMGAEELDSARRELIGQELIAWKKPVYQVLPFEDQVCIPLNKEAPREIPHIREKRGTSQLISIRQCLKQLSQEAL